MSAKCFVDQVATEDILQRVTSVCAECYDELEVGVYIYYDLQNYRYLCHSCYNNQLIEVESTVDDDRDGLFA
jgi:hypothetical protein